MRRALPWIIGLLALALVGAAIWRAVAARQADADRAAAAQRSAPAKLQLAASDVASVARRELLRELDVSGTVKAVNTALIKARISGEVRSLGVREGDAVRAGQVLVQIDSTEADWRLRQAEQQAQAAKAQWDIAQRSLANNRALVAQGFISPTALETSIANEAGTQASYAAAQAAMELARKQRADTSLATPIAGWVSQRFVQAGERVGIDARLLEVVDLSRLEVEVTAPPEAAAALRVGAAARLRVEGVPDEISAQVVRLNPSAQAGSRSLVAYLSLPSHPALRHGLFAKGHVTLESKTALALPALAVRLDQSKPYVLAVEAGKVRQRGVELGAAEGSGGWQEIRAGLAEGQVVLLRGAGALAEGTAVALPANSAAGAASAARP